MQFHRTDLNPGMVMIYKRPQSAYSNANYRLHGPSAGSEYLINYGQNSIKVKGGVLMSDSLQVTLDFPVQLISSSINLYKKNSSMDLIFNNLTKMLR